MANEYEIKSVLPVSGDWFVISNPEDERWFIERVVSWALVVAEGKVDHIKAIGPTGLPSAEEDGDSYFVYGDDESHFGVTWREVFNKSTPSPHIVREFSEHFRIDSEKIQEP